MDICFRLYIQIQMGYLVFFLVCIPSNRLVTARKIRNNKPQITLLQRVFLFPKMTHEKVSMIEALNVRCDRVGKYRHSSVSCLYILTDLYLHAFLYKLLGVIKSYDISEEYSNNLCYDWNA